MRERYVVCVRACVCAWMLECACVWLFLPTHTYSHCGYLGGNASGVYCCCFWIRWFATLWIRIIGEGVCGIFFVICFDMCCKCWILSCGCSRACLFWFMRDCHVWWLHVTDLIYENIHFDNIVDTTHIYLHITLHSLSLSNAHTHTYSYVYTTDKYQEDIHTRHKNN